MSIPRGNGQNGGHFYSNITQPVKIDLNFVTDVANGNGLGVRSVKSNGYVRNVFMHTSASPGVHDGYTNPNPNVGYVLIQFKNNFRYYLGGFAGIVPPLSSSNLTSVSAGTPYVITTLGTTTLAQWQASGLPMGLVPTVGQSFIAIRTGALGGTGTMGAPGIPTVLQTSVVGDPNASINSFPVATAGGAWLLVQLMAATNSSTTTLVAASPADGSVISLPAYFDASSVTIDGL